MLKWSFSDFNLNAGFKMKWDFCNLKNVLINFINLNLFCFLRDELFSRSYKNQTLYFLFVCKFISNLVRNLEFITYLVLILNLLVIKIFKYYFCKWISVCKVIWYLLNIHPRLLHKFGLKQFFDYLFY